MSFVHQESRPRVTYYLGSAQEAKEVPQEIKSVMINIAKDRQK